MLLCGFFWGSNRNHYYLLFLVLVVRTLATSISMFVLVPTEIQKIIYICTTIIPTAVPWDIFNRFTFVLKFVVFQESGCVGIYIKKN